MIEAVEATCSTEHLVLVEFPALVSGDVGLSSVGDTATLHLRAVSELASLLPPASMLLWTDSAHLAHRVPRKYRKRPMAPRPAIVSSARLALR